MTILSIPSALGCIFIIQSSVTNKDNTFPVL